jgi:amino acid transporter
MNSSFQIIGLLVAFAMVIFFYRHSIENIFKTPKESILLALPIIFLGVLFYFFFKFKGF